MLKPYDFKVGDRVICRRGFKGQFVTVLPNSIDFITGLTTGKLLMQLRDTKGLWGATPGNLWEPLTIEDIKVIESKLETIDDGFDFLA